MSFRKFDHVERRGHSEVDGIEIGDVYVFPKIDGTCASVWSEPFNGDDFGTLSCGSRRRQIVPGDDNAGFAKYVHDNPDRFVNVLTDHPTWVIYGEWLVPHTLKTYRENAWRLFYVFDVFDTEAEQYIDYPTYSKALEAEGFDVLPPLATFTNPTEEQLLREVEMNTYLIQENSGPGEGIVIKNYTWRNQYGRQPWSKIVRAEFKDENRRQFGAPAKGEVFQVEVAIAEEFVTAALVAKCRAKIVLELTDKRQAPGLEPEGAWAEVVREVEEANRGQLIPRLLQTVFYDIIREESWAFLKKHKFPTVDYGQLRRHVTARTKLYAKDLF